ncbi:MAG: hypothetical protein WA418_24520 [Bradyrhizobium sp.]
MTVSTLPRSGVHIYINAAVFDGWQGVMSPEREAGVIAERLKYYLYRARLPSRLLRVKIQHSGNVTVSVFVGDVEYSRTYPAPGRTVAVPQEMQDSDDPFGAPIHTDADIDALDIGDPQVMDDPDADEVVEPRVQTLLYGRL